MSPASLRMSIGIRRRWAAKVVFIMGMYWCAKSPDTDTTRIRLCRPVGISLVPRPAGVGLEEEPVSEKFSVALLMYERASVRAPAICVVVVVEMSDSVVVEIKFRREERRQSSMSANGRYLFASSRCGAWPSISTSSEVEEEEGRGYSHTAR